MSRTRTILNRSATITASVTAAFLASTFLAAGIFAQEPSASANADVAAPAAAPAIPASVARVEQRHVELWTRYSGRLEAVDRVEIRSRVAGAIAATHFREGSLIASGDPLVTIDPAPYRAAVERAQSEVDATKARLVYSLGERDRGAQLQTSRTISSSEYERRQQASLEIAAQLAAAEANLRTAQLDLEYTEIRAPVSGRIGRFEVTTGNLVSAGAGSPVLAHMVSVDPIYASFDADEQTVERLRTAGGVDNIQGIPVEMDLSDGRVVEGRIQLIDPSVDPVNGTVGIRVAFANPDGALMPGQFARIRLGQPQAEPALLVSERSIGTDQDKRYVLVVDDEDTVQYREIAPGAVTGDMRVVEKGLRAEERVVVNGLQRLRPGDRIAPQIVSMETGRALDRQASVETNTP